MIQDLRISMIQSPIRWDNIDGNLAFYRNKLRCVRGKTDLAVLPETFTTGFLASIEPNQSFQEEKVTQTLLSWSQQFKMAITGSFIAKDNGLYYNRGFWVTPDQTIQFYDKRHLFRMGGEHKHFSPGNKQLIVSYKGWNICLQICYDLRFPIWSRNIRNKYDLLIYVANWPASRREVWLTLLKARAIENQAYVCGVNRTGIDEKGLQYSGDSTLYSFKGKKTATAGKSDRTRTCSINHDTLDAFRQKFPAWMDADQFKILL